MIEQKNIILAVVLSLAIIIGFDFFFKPDTPPAPAPAQQAAQSGDPAASSPAVTPGQDSPVGATPSAGAPADDTPVGAAALPQAQQQESGGLFSVPGTRGAEHVTTQAELEVRNKALSADPRISIDTGKLQGSIRLTGARIDDIVLTEFRESIEDDAQPVRLLHPQGSFQPFFVDFGWIVDPASENKIEMPGANTLWTADRDSLTVGTPVTLSWTNPTGQTFRQKISIDENYLFSVEQSVENAGNESVTVLPYGRVRRVGTPLTTGFYILHEGPLGVFNGVLEEVDYSDLVEDSREAMARSGQARQTTRPFESQGGWLGITDKYWLAALVPDQKTTIKATINHSASDQVLRVDEDYMMSGAHRYQTDYLAEPIEVAAGATAGTTTHAYIGAKRLSLLDDYEETLGVQSFDLAIDFGWFYFLTKPIFLALVWLYHLVGNYGVAILVLTVAIKLVFFPLANKSYVSMSKMKKLQPKMVELRERYGEDRQRLNQEMMQLYKNEKVNPMSGCLPILIQIPVFFALYKVLYVSIEMRQAPFFGWIEDLSAPDPTTLFNLFGLIPWTPPSWLPLIGVWPVLMGATMYLQQKLNPAPADPVQAKVFMFLPFLFTVMLAGFPAGLVIYWAWNNGLSILQQWVIMRRMGVKVGGGEDK
jgi:YidC/Oxa1 family membrane protein insertase